MLNTLIPKKQCKHLLYLISMGILIVLSSLILIQAPFQFTGMEFFSTVLNRSSLILSILFGAVCLICFFLLIAKRLSTLSEQKQMHLTLILAGLGIFLQYFLLIYIQPVLRYDHLRVFDGAMEILQTETLSLSANDSYFGRYPFNISIAVFNSLILRLLQFFNIAETYYMLGLQCTYLFLIDLGIFFSWKLLRILHSLKIATLFLILCIFNPILYVCASGCYTTTLMVPLLMASMLSMISFLKETSWKKKCILGFLTGILLALGSRLRATVLISGIALVIYLLIRSKTATEKKYSKKHIVLFAGIVLFGSILSFGSFTMYQNSYITEDASDTQMPPLYYLMFATNPDTRGTYNEGDYETISAYDTLKEKNEVSWQILKERIDEMGISGALSLANHKLAMTWSDGTDDYSDFLITSRNYSKLQSWIAGEQSDFYALYCHMFHIAILILFLAAAVSILKKQCTPYYLIFVTLLGGMIFHIFWESYYVYSFGFSMLLLMASSDGTGLISEMNLLQKKVPLQRFFNNHNRMPQRSVNFSVLFLMGISSFFLLLICFLPCMNTLRNIPYAHAEYAVVQDMNIGENKPLLSGDCITQTFQTDRPFNEIACKVFHTKGTANQSKYRFELLSENHDLLFQTEFCGSQVQDKDYCYFKIGDIVPETKQSYTIRITPLFTSSEHFLTFGYYNTHNYDIYADGMMTGVASDERSDLTFQVYQTTETNFYH